MKQLKDYLHFYIGCECIIGDSKEVDYIRMVNETGLSVCTGTNKNDIQLWYKTSSCKPILRPLSDMKKEDIDLGDFIPEYEILPQIFTGGYCIELDSVHNDGYCLIIYPDGSMFCICKGNGENYPFRGGELFKQLLSKHFDLFDLIESGLAIDKTIIQSNL